MTITAHGTASAPIVVDHLGSAKPVLDNSIDVQGSSWLVIRHLQVVTPNLLDNTSGADRRRRGVLPRRLPLPTGLTPGPPPTQTSACRW